MMIVSKGLRRLKRSFTSGRPVTIETYKSMQKYFYKIAALESKFEPGVVLKDNVVGYWQDHDSWRDNETYLMKYVPENPIWIALDFGCGPGRNILGWTERFARIDGADISKQNLKNARIFLAGQLADSKNPKLFVTDGTNCGDTESGAYDFIFSTICLQHIASHAVRYSILKDMFRILKPNGRISLQMGYESISPTTVGYFDNDFSTSSTNGGRDTNVSTYEEPKNDLEKIGFTNFEYWIRDTPQQGNHAKWIFFTATKPKL